MGGKKSLKKIVCLITVLMTTAFSLVGCGGNKDNAANYYAFIITIVTSVVVVTDCSF